MKESSYNVDTLLKAYTAAKGDISFMSVPNVEESVDATMRADDEGGLTAGIQTEGDTALVATDTLVDAQIEQQAADSIQNSVQANPEGVQAALIDGMSALTKIEARIKANSGNVNHQGIGLQAIHNTYMSYAKGGVSTEATALAMAENIRAVMQTQTLTVAEKAQLMGVLTEIVGSTELAEAYVGTGAALEGMLGEIDSGSGMGKNEIRGEVKRPTWRESEDSAQKIYTDYEAQKSFLNGVEVKYGKKGSSRVDFYKNGSSIEVKNYNIETKRGRDRLVRVLEYQVNKRIIDLPTGTEQIILIDVRGQNVDMATLRELRDLIRSKCKVDVIILFMR